MTETAYPVKTPNGHDFTSTSLLQRPPPDFHNHHGAVAVQSVQDDDGQISCVCGYFDDDGWTVACDSCNKWQHQLCYYPEYENRSLPEALQHYCVDCREGIVIDIQRARDRQRARRDEQQLVVNGVKRQPSKSHKKKVKELGYTNGWPLDKSRHDRNSASPRDQPPPAKRPKTSHRTSDSMTTANNKGHSRKRTLTNASHRRSLSRSPDSPIDLYSEEFMRCYRSDDWAVTDANLHDSIAIANALSDWLNASEEEFHDKHGQEKGEILMRWDGRIDDIPGKAQLEIAQEFDDRMRADDSHTSMWKTITVKESVAEGAFIGELKGHVGFKEDYQHDPANRWALLRHPEPFVFFHPRLPIYIDARTEGTELRYVRRSCQPNARLRILVTGGTTYHFCFMATKQIDPGMEIAISWDTIDSVPELMRRGDRDFSQRDMHQLSSWVSTVLANCGPCACHSHEYECLMARFDRRGEDQYDDASSVKPPKSKKKRLGRHISPLNTNFNSRSGSEARKVDPEDEQSDSRSASGSAGRGSLSRDITPNTHYSHAGSLSTAPELSERERKKLAKEEEMFRRQEEERTGKTGKKKRNSAGSALNTPSGTSSKQLGFGGGSRYADAGTSKQTGLPSAKPGRKPKPSNAQKTPVRTIYKTVKRPAPDYVDSEVQCDMDKEDAEKRAMASPPRRPFLSTTQRLLHRCALNNARRRSPVVSPESFKPLTDDKMDVDVPPNTKPPSWNMMASPPEPRPRPLPGSAADTEMKDAETVRVNASHPQNSLGDRNETMGMPPPTVSSGVPSVPTSMSSAPSWSSQSAALAQDQPEPILQASKPPEMHLQMPPPPANPFAGAASLSAGTPTSTSLSGVMSQSPATMTAPSWLASPGVAAAVTPSPAKKKMSLSDYTKRNKIKDKEVEPKTERDSSPASVASGPIVPPLQASESTRAAAEGGSAIEDDVHMEDGSDLTPASSKV